MNFEQLDVFIKEGKVKREIISEMKINKARFMENLKEKGFVNFKAYVAHINGEYRAPSSIINKFTFEQISDAILKHKNIDDTAASLGVFASSLTKICRFLGYSNFGKMRAKVLNEKEVSLYEGKVLTLVVLGYSLKDACDLCEIKYDKFKWYFNQKYNVSLRQHVLSLQGKRRFEKHERKEYRQAWMKGNVQQKLTKRISTSILKCLGKAKLSKTSIILKNELGYTIDDLKVHLEKQFDANMNWKNHGIYWHIDHRTPVTWFSFHSSSCEGFRQCWALNNLQPKEAIENMRKGNRYAD